MDELAKLDYGKGIAARLAPRSCFSVGGTLAKVECRIRFRPAALRSLPGDGRRELLALMLEFPGLR